MEALKAKIKGLADQYYQKGRRDQRAPARPS